MRDENGEVKQGSLARIDSRAQEFPPTVPEGVERLVTDAPEDVVAGAEAGAVFIIMTHQHPLDYALGERVLRRGDASYIGIIGSASKWRRFRLRLAHRGFDATQIDRVRCPIGLAAVPGKQPAEIAVSVAAELIAHYHALRPPRDPAPGPSWKALGETLRHTGAADILTVDPEA